MYQYSILLNDNGVQLGFGILSQKQSHLICIIFLCLLIGSIFVLILVDLIIFPLRAWAIESHPSVSSCVAVGREATDF